MRMDPSPRRLRSYSDMANTWRSSHKPWAADHHHWTFVAHPPQPRGQLGLPECHHVPMPPCRGQPHGDTVEDDGVELGDMIYTVFIPPEWEEHNIRDRKSTRLNSSHQITSYA